MANPSLTQYSSAGDGFVRNHGAGSWASIRDAASGTSASSGATTSSVYADGTTADKYIDRSFFAFDLSSIPVGADIISATLSLYVSAKGSDAGGAVGIVEGTQASASTLATSDYSLFGTTEFASRINFASATAGAYSAFALNASGLAYLKTKFGSTAKLCARPSFDIDNSAPGSTVWSTWTLATSEASGTSTDPKLLVTYSLDRATADSWAWSDRAISGASATPAVPRVSDDVWAWSDTATRSLGRGATDAWAWNDLAVPTQAAPSARTALGSAVTVFAPTAADGTFGAYRGFGSTAILADGRLLCLAAKASYHAAPDAVIVGKYSSDGGATWGSEVAFPTIAGAEVTVLASGRLGAVTDGGTGTNRYPEYIYSDDHGATWSTPVTITWDFYTGRNYVNDVVELPNGDLLASAHGEDTAGGVQLLRWSKSTDDGATWAPLSSVAAIGGYNTVEQRCAVMNNGGVYAVFHTEDGGGSTDYYYVYSHDGGATWGTPVLLEAGNSFNRQGLTHFDDDRLIIGVNSTIPYTWTYRETLDGHTYGTAVSIASSPSPRIPLKSAAVALPGGAGATQNVGFTYSDEALDQQQASTYYRQFSGTDGAAVWQRTTGDSWAWSDSNTHARFATRTTADSWAWSDAAARSPQTFTRTTSYDHGFEGTYDQIWLWSDTAAPTVIDYLSRNTSDTWAWSDTAVRSADPALRTTSDTWAWGDTAADTYAGPHYYSRTTSDTWAWSDSTGALGTALYWLRAARRRSMSAPTKTYTVVQEKGTTRTATWTSPTYESKTEAGILVALDVTAASGTGGLTLRINAHDLAGSTVVPLNTAPTAVTAIGTTSYALYPFGAISGAVTQSTSGYLPRQFSITVTAGDSSSYTYSVGYCLLP